MKVKQIVIGLTSLVVAIIGIVSAPSLSYAASCGGVQTSIINCQQSGACSDGTDLYEGTNPSGDATKAQAYRATYQHDYGKCKSGEVNNAVTNSGLWGVMLMVLNIMTAGIGILAVAGVVYATVLYTSAADRPEQVKKAKEIITNVVIGLIAYGLMYSFLNFLIPGGIFT